MAWHEHREKRLRQSKVRRTRNVARKNAVKKAGKAVRAAAIAGDAAGAAVKVRSATTLIAKAAKTGTLHRKTAARRISRLAKAANKAAAKAK
jgi:small subunit ribosomal protein S20